MISIARIIDKYFIGLFILIFFWLKCVFIYKKKSIIQHPKRILIIRLWALWSSLLTFPMIKQLQDHYGENVKYDLLATSRNIGVFKNQWYFDQIYNFFSLKGFLKILFGFKKYDIVIDAEEYFCVSSLISLWVWKLTAGYDNVFIRRLAYLFPCHYSERKHNLLNCLSLLIPFWIHIYLPKVMEPLIYEHKHTVKVDEFLHQFVGKKIICLHTWWAETSPDRFRANDNWVSLIERVYKLYWDRVAIFLSGTVFEEKWVHEIMIKLSHNSKKIVFSLCGMFGLFDFAYLLTKCHLMISNDTGPMHLAAAMWTKTIGLFGPNLPQIFGPWPLDRNVWLYKGSGIIYIQPHVGIFKKDISNTINRITPEDVLDEIKLLML